MPEFQHNHVQEVSSEFCQHRLYVCLDPAIQKVTVKNLLSRQIFEVEARVEIRPRLQDDEGRGEPADSLGGGAGQPVQPGQFHMLKTPAPEPLLPRPISIHDVEGDTLSFLYEVKGAGTRAIGDLVPGPMLAHKASAEGMAAAQTIAGKFGEVNYDAIPAIVYTAPEVASVGLTEEQVKERGIPYITGVYPFTGNGRAKCFGDTEGLVKLIAHRKTDRLLGAHIIGVRAAEMIAEAVLAVEFGASLEDLAGTVHGHPTFAEAIMEAAMAAHR